jgi:hypothetical protein
MCSRDRMVYSCISRLHFHHAICDLHNWLPTQPGSYSVYKFDGDLGDILLPFSCWIYQDMVRSSHSMEWPTGVTTTSSLRGELSGLSMWSSQLNGVRLSQDSSQGCDYPPPTTRSHTTSFENLGIPRDDLSPYIGMEKVSVRYYFHCLLNGMLAWIEQLSSGWKFCSTHVL